jgi:hypothetical protein
MATTYGKAGWPVPATGDVPTGPGILQAIATQLDNFVIPKYPSSAAQTTANPTPTNGDMWYRQDQSAGWQYRGSAGALVDADSFFLIATSTLASPAASVLFSAIPQTARHLRLVISAQSAYASNYYDNIQLRFNASASAIYGSSFSGTWPPTSGPQASNGSSATSAVCGFAWARQTATASAGRSVVDIFDYRDTNWYKGFVFRGFAGDGGSAQQNAAGGGAWGSTAGVTSLTLLLASASNFQTHSLFSLYGFGS